MRESSLPKVLLRPLRPQLPQMLATLRKFVLAESPSLEKFPADHCCGIVASEWSKRKTHVERGPQMQRGDHLRITWVPQTSRASGQLLVLGHYDTVYASGSLAKMP